MKLEKVKIHNCRSVEQATLPIDERLTALVGANEHGKSNLLWAVSLLDFKTSIRHADKRVMKNPISSADPRPSFVLYELTAADEERGGLERAMNGIVETQSSEAAAQEQPETQSAAEGEKKVEAADAKVPEKKPEPTIVPLPKDLVLRIEFKDGKTNQYSLVGIEDTKLQKRVLEQLKSLFQEKIFFFDTFEDRLKHRIPKDEVINKTDSITNGLIKLAGLQGREAAIFEDSAIARQLQTRGSEQLTDQLKKLWVQGKEDDIQAKLSISTDGNFLNVDIEDYNTYGDVSTRSRGFLFFLSFILKYKEYHSGDLKNFIFLIDEPGIFLHPRGQKDLLLYLERLSEFNQVIYTTHSPFTINRLYNFRVRVISKDKEIGTKVDVKPYIHNWKSLRASLGMMLADSFYYADNNLIVEGPSDRLFIITLLRLFHENGIIPADLNILSVIDAGGCPNVPAMAKIIKSEERPFVVLIDSDEAAKTAKKSLTKVVAKEHLKQVADFKQDAITIEDLLPRKYLNRAINAYLEELAQDGIIKAPTSKFATRTTGVMAALKEFIETNKLGVESISKLNIARHFESEATEFDAAEFKECKPLLEWVVSSLKIGL